MVGTDVLTMDKLNELLDDVCGYIELVGPTSSASAGRLSYVLSQIRTLFRETAERERNALLALAVSECPHYQDTDLEGHWGSPGKIVRLVKLVEWAFARIAFLQRETGWEEGFAAGKAAGREERRKVEGAIAKAQAELIQMVAGRVTGREG